MTRAACEPKWKRREAIPPSTQGLAGGAGGQNPANDRTPTIRREFRFAFDRSYRRISWLFGITESRALLTVIDGTLTVRFGPWQLTTTLGNVTSAQVTGPYRYLKTAGPAHLSFSDHGLTFATNGRRGLCLQFQDPVPAMDPFGLIRHPNLTVTIADTTGLLEILNRPGSPTASTG